MFCRLAHRVVNQAPNSCACKVDVRDGEYLESSGTQLLNYSHMCQLGSRQYNHRNKLLESDLAIN